MQSSNAPAKLTLPFANSGGKNTIPVASQIGITPGAASFTDGFPPLTRTPLNAGGVPPFGLDHNGILYQLSSVLRWVNAGGTFVYDSTFANDSNVGGYPKGARVARSDGTGYWFNTADNNTTDPESAGAAAAGWVPDFTNGVATVAMSSANVTLTPLQYGKPIIVITGALTSNLNLIFPPIADSWIVVNSTSGAYSITCKTQSGTGISVPQGVSSQIFCNGSSVYLLNALPDFLFPPVNVASAATVDLTGASRKVAVITGTTNISAWSMTTGEVIDVIFAGALTLIYNATTNALPGADNITTASGDRAKLWYDGTTVYCMTYTRADGTPLKAGITSYAPVSLAGTATDITVSQSNAKRITVILYGMSTNGSSIPSIRLGTAGGVAVSGYQDNGGTIIGSSGAGAVGHSQGFLLGNGGVSASSSITGTLVLVNMGNNTWVVQSAQFYQADSQISFTAGGIALSGPLTKIRATTINGTDTFDAGTMALLVES